MVVLYYVQNIAESALRKQDLSVNKEAAACPWLMAMCSSDSESPLVGSKKKNGSHSCIDDSCHPCGGSAVVIVI